MESTSATLLSRLKQSHADASWERFCRIYAAPIIRYGRKLGLSDADARDVMQESLLILMRLLPQFEYDRQRGRFRSYLLNIVHKQALGFLRRARRHPVISLDADGPDGLPPLEVVAPEQESGRDVRWQEALFDEAWSRLAASGRLQPATLAVFEDYVIRGRDCEEVAKKHGIAANTVYQMRNRVIGILKSEVRLMLAEMDPDEFEPMERGTP